MKNDIVLRTVARLFIPFIVLLAFYVQLHGEYSPGGGFQAGVIGAAAYILHALVFGIRNTRRAMPSRLLQQLAATGVLLYAGTGIAGMLLGGAFLDYSVLASPPQLGQKIGIIAIELGVGLTVFSVMLILYFAFAERR